MGPVEARGAPIGQTIQSLYRTLCMALRSRILTVAQLSSAVLNGLSLLHHLAASVEVVGRTDLGQRSGDGIGELLKIRVPRWCVIYLERDRERERDRVLYDHMI